MSEVASLVDKLKVARDVVSDFEQQLTVLLTPLLKTNPKFDPRDAVVESLEVMWDQTCIGVRKYNDKYGFDDFIRYNFRTTVVFAEDPLAEYIKYAEIERLAVLTALQQSLEAKTAQLQAQFDQAKAELHKANVELAHASKGTIPLFPENKIVQESYVPSKP